MSGKWHGSNRNQRLPSDWAQRRARVMKRDGWRCQHEDNGIICGDRATDCDHIQRGDDHSLQNLQALCRYHHKQKTAAEALEAKKKKAAEEAEKVLLEKFPGMKKKSG